MLFMSFEYHHLDKFGLPISISARNCSKARRKAIVLISGASSSGKSFSAEVLQEIFEHNGHHAVIVSLDQYDYGLSGIIPNKVNANDFQNSLQNLPEIEKRIKTSSSISPSKRSIAMRPALD
jgi:chloramphenicol 3-O-phosphotransferase